jgi:hypothetical protein
LTPGRFGVAPIEHASARKFLPIAVFERAAMSAAPAGALRNWRRLMPSIPSRLMNPGWRAWVSAGQNRTCARPEQPRLVSKICQQNRDALLPENRCKGRLGDFPADFHCRAYLAARGALPCRSHALPSRYRPTLGALQDMIIRRPPAPTS